ncbi:hypothetical protein BDV25DRAFT_77791 [Aspergillus avenaceus]|uniref:Uncharacterized protein n=1 Tax=Aspergillus avenaceus TaxID=36643 RepID=A0A5N6TG27_ASPAV|nr:hypothetical protein BDV25DRAFT_77791 [Aspergillus avenaceus]
MGSVMMYDHFPQFGLLSLILLCISLINRLLSWILTLSRPMVSTLLRLSKHQLTIKNRHRRCRYNEAEGQWVLYCRCS